MKTILPRFTCLLLATLYSVISHAYDFKFDDICYNILSEENRTVEVTSDSFFQIPYVGNIEIPSEIIHQSNTYTVIAIGEKAFKNCMGLTSIIIPNTITSIGSYAFEECTGLTYIVIPNSIITIGTSAFQDCTTLTAITIGNSITSIGNDAFRGCSNLTSINIPNSVATIGNGAFLGCSNMTSIELGYSVTSIGDYALRDCNSLTKIDVDIRNTVYSSIDGILYSKDTSILFHQQGCFRWMYKVDISGYPYFSYYYR